MSEYTNISAGLAARLALEKHGFRFTHSLGQNFILDDDLLGRMLDLALIEPDGRVLEIGPGAGVMTRLMAGRGADVTAVELDETLRPVLEDMVGGCPNVHLVFADALKADLRALMGEEPFSVIANLPYYIATDLIEKLLTGEPKPRRLTVMVQKEAAERLCAAPGTRECGAVSLAVQYYAEPQPLFAVSRGSFMPAPHVDSAVIRLAVRPQPPVTVADEKRLFAVIRAAFGQRRKTLVNAVSAAGYTSAEIRAALDDMGLSPTVRAEELTLAQFAALTDRLTAGQ